MSDKYNQYGYISEQWLAEQIAQKEGKAKEVDIAQIKEILKITLEILHEIQIEEGTGKLDELLRRHS